MDNAQSAEMLSTLNDAVLAISEGLSLPRTLQRIVDTARVLANVKYAALGVFTEDGSELYQFVTAGIMPHKMLEVAHEPKGEGLLGAIENEKKPIRISHIQDDTRSVGFPKGHPMMSAFLGVPIMNRGKTLGNLYLCDRVDNQPFDEKDEEIVTLLAAHAAIAIENTRLHEDLKALALSGERDRIGMELHDGVIQSIYAVGMKVEIISGQLELTEQQQEQFQTILQDLNQIIDDIRAYIQNLISAHDEQTTLRQKVENLATHFQDFSGVNVVINILDGLPALTNYQRHNLMQILREALANIARHAQATEATINVRPHERLVILSVTDNGIGLGTEWQNSEAGHFGLRNIARRAKRLGGTLEFKSEPGQGANISVSFPANTSKPGVVLTNNSGEA